MTNIDSRTTFQVWEFLIYDETLSRAVFDGTYKDLASKRGYSSEQIAVLDWFASQPGMRWNVENLRFRAALETAACLGIHMPHTARLISRNDDDWLQDICYEYLAYYNWDALGHRRLTECQRFGTYTRERIMRRRIMPASFEHVLDLELAIVDVHRKTAEAARSGWPERRKLTASELETARPRRGIAHRLLEQPIDLRPFLAATKPLEVIAGPGPVTWLIHIGGPAENHKMKVVSAGPVEVLERCAGTATTAEIAASMEDEFGLPREQVSALIDTWVTQGILDV